VSDTGSPEPLVLNKDKQLCPLERGKFAVVDISMFWRTAYAVELLR
jgi:hypothetical protein